MKKVISGLFILLLSSTCVWAADVIKIGAVYPSTGSLAPTAEVCRSGVDLALEIINNPYDLDLPLARSEGIESLGGAKLEIVYGDSQGDPNTGMAEAERIINSEKVVAMVGGYQSAVVKTASYAAERAKIPYVLSDATSPLLTRRGFKWFFRVNPDDTISAQNFYECVRDVKEKFGTDLKRIAILYENTEWGAKVAEQLKEVQKEFGAQQGFEIVADISYHHGATDVTSEVLKLKESNPDVLMHAGYVSDAILYTKTFKNLEFNVKLWLGMGGYLDPNYTETMQEDSYYVVIRSTFNPDLATIKPMIAKVNEIYKEKYGQDMSGVAARSFNAPFVLADAINRAGSTNAEDIRNALLETNLSGNQILPAWEGVEFNDIHQNIHARYILVQIQDGKVFTVWPWNAASKEMVFPIPAWNER